MNTLFKGLGEGFKNFGKNIMKHMVNGFFEWLLGSGIAITFPAKFDLQGVLDILLQVLGVSKNAIFDLAASLLPDWAVELLELLMERGVGALSGMMETLTELGVPSYVLGFFKAIASFPQKGIMALWDFLKTVFSSLKGDFITTIITQLVVPEVVVAGIQWMVGLLNPVGGIFKIVKGIVDVISFLVDNKDLIFEVLNSIAATFSALISKSWSPVAMAVEFALAKIIPLALGLFVSLLGLGGIPKKISKVVEKLRAPVDKGLSKILGKIGFFLDPVGAIEDGVSGMRDKAASKRNKKKGKGDSDRDDDDKTTKKTTDKDIADKDAADKESSTKENSSKDTSIKSTSTKDKSNPPDAKSSETSTTKKSSVKDSSTASTDKSSGKKKKDLDDKDSTKKDKDKEKKDKDKNDKADSNKQRLKSAMKAVDTLSDSKRDPDAVKRELPGLKKKHKLDTLTLTKRGDDKYKVVGKAKVSKKKGTKVQRKAAKGGWTDDRNQVRVKKRLSASKTKVGSFTVDTSLIEKDAVLKKVEKSLKRTLKINARIDVVEKQVARLKSQYKLKKLKIIKLKPNGRRYHIVGEISQGKSAQRKAAGSGTPQVSANIETAIQRSQGQGQEIAPVVRNPLEQAFGTDFSPVRIHTGNEGDRLSRSLDAKAFTTGRDIFFKQGNYAPETPSGKHLLAHELTHVVQQSGEQPSVMTQRVSRASADPPTVQRVQQGSNSGQGLWIQREEEDVSDAEGASAEEMAEDSTGDMAVGVAGAAADAAVGMAVNVAVDAAVDTAASKLMPGAKVKSKITSDKTKLTMDVKVKDRDIDNDDGDQAFEDEMPEDSGLPGSLVNDIVRAIQDIVDQDPDPDVVARKLNAVRVMFEMQLVRLVSYAEVGQSFEYVIKINGRAKFLRASKISGFLKRLGSGKRKAVMPLENGEPASSNRSKSEPSKLKSGDVDADSASTGKAETNKATADKAKTEPLETEDTTTNSIDSSESSQAPEDSPAKVKPSSSSKADSSKAKLEEAQEREMSTQSKVRRIDAETVDVIIRAQPQPKTV